MPRTKNIPFTFILDYLLPSGPHLKPFFGCYGVYVGEQIVFILRDKDTYTECNGLWIATSFEHHKSLKKEFPSLTSVSVLSGGSNTTAWQMLPADSDDFESSAIRACELVLKGDKRIGKIPKPKKKKKKSYLTINKFLTMEMTKYLIDTFNYNSYANKKVFEKVKQLPDKEQCMKFLSHLANCQYKWMARIMQDPKVREMDWWKPLYSTDDWTKEWDKSLQLWLDYLSSKTDDEISKYVIFTGYDGGPWSAKPQDIALQLNYHSIHHRAQIQTIIRQQGLEPDFVDYIGTVYRKLS